MVYNMCMEQKDPSDGISEEDLANALNDAMETIKKNTYTAPTVDLHVDSFTGEFASKNHKKYNYKTMSKDYNPTKYYDYPKDNGVAEKINSLWQEIKNLQAQVAIASTMLKQQDITIKELREQLHNVDSDKLQEMNDRIDDLESRIDLIDE